MDVRTISRILKAHGVPFFVFRNIIYADSMESGIKLFSKLIKFNQNTNKATLYQWLGY